MAYDLTLEVLKTAVPKLSDANARTMLGPINAAMREFEINTAGRFSIYRVAAFLAQAGHETLSFMFLVEQASGWDYDPSVNLVKANALGNMVKGDGPKYRGRGLFQYTGLFNYRRLSDYFKVDFVATPELLQQPVWAARSAGLFWMQKGLSTLADKNQFEAITRKINGGLNGQEDRVARYERALKALQGAAIGQPQLVAATPGVAVTAGAMPPPLNSPIVAGNDLPITVAGLPAKWLMGGLGLFGVGAIISGWWLKRKK